MDYYYLVIPNIILTFGIFYPLMTLLNYNLMTAVGSVLSFVSTIGFSISRKYGSLQHPFIITILNIIIVLNIIEGNYHVARTVALIQIAYVVLWSVMVYDDNRLSVLLQIPYLIWLTILIREREY